MTNVLIVLISLEDTDMDFLEAMPDNTQIKSSMQHLWSLFQYICCSILSSFVDCIGSAFNMKGAMQCPNCRNVEKGQWLYANGSTRSLHEWITDDWIPDEDFFDPSYSEMVKCSYSLFVSGV